MEMTLKYKYRLGLAPGSYVWAPKFNKHSDNNAPSTRRKLTGKALEAAHAKQGAAPVMHLRADGKVRMERRS
jgi:hypothetical protein